MSYYVSVVFEVLGSGVAALIGLTLVVGVVYWQYHEYRSWRFSKRAYLLLKLGAPVTFILMGLLATAIAGTVEGMEALGVFYLGMALALVAAPFSVAMLGPMFDIPFRAAAAISGSLFLTLFAALWGVSLFINAGGSVVNKNWDYKREKHLRQESLQNPEAAGDRVMISGTEILLLPNGNRLLVTSVKAQSGWQVTAIDVEATGLRPSSRSFCHDGDQLHVFDVVKEVSQVKVRVLYYTAGNENGPYIGVQTLVDIPADESFDGYLQFYEHNGIYTLTAPLPVHDTIVKSGENKQLMRELLDIPQPKPGRTVYEDNACVPLEFNAEPIDQITFQLFSQEFHRSQFSLSPRHIEPQYR